MFGRSLRVVVRDSARFLLPKRPSIGDVGAPPDTPGVRRATLGGNFFGCAYLASYAVSLNRAFV